MCPSAFTPFCVQEGLIDVININPQSQCVRSPDHFPDLLSWLSHHEWMQVQVEATVKRLASARLNQAYAGAKLIQMMGKGKGRAPEASPLGRAKSEKAERQGRPRQRRLKISSLPWQ